MSAHPDPTVETAEQLLDRHFAALPGLLGDEQAESVYAMAYHLMNQGQGANAIRLLSLLTLVRPAEARYWHALGACRRKLDDPSGAAEALLRAVDLDPNQPKPALMLVESLLALGMRDDALSLLETVLEIVRAGDDAAAISRAEGLRELLARPLQ